MAKVVDGVSKGLDALVFTDEERAELNARVGNTIVDWMNTSKGQNLSRRWIAVMVTSVWCIGVFVILLYALATPFLPVGAANNLSAAITDVIALYDKIGLTTAFMLVIGFYFAAPHIGKIADVAVGKFTKPKS